MTEDGYPVFGANGVIGFYNQYNHEEATVLIGCRGSCGAINVCTPKSWVTGNSMALDDLDKNLVNQDYLVYALKFDGLQSVVTGTSQPQITQTTLKRVEIPLPPLEEQTRIAGILDAADQLRIKRQQVITKLNILREAIFQETFGDPHLNPMSWPTTTLGDICDVKGGKRLPKGSNYASEVTPFPYIRVTDFKHGEIEFNDLKFLTQEIQALISRYTVASGDAIISIAGSIGQVASVPAELDGANLTENAAKLVIKESGSLDVEFLVAILKSDYCQQQMVAKTGQVTIGKLALFRIADLSIFLPPFNIQQKFNQVMSKLRGYEKVLLSSSDHLDNLFQSIQQRAFRGDL